MPILASTVAIPATTPSAPAVSSSRKIVIVYRPDSNAAQRVYVQPLLSPHTTRLNNEAFARFFDNISSISCQLYAKSLLAVAGADHAFTVIMACIHDDEAFDDSTDAMPNSAIQALLPPNSRTIEGPAIVVKHATVNDLTLACDAEILDITAAEKSLVDELIRRLTKSQSKTGDHYHFQISSLDLYPHRLIMHTKQTSQYTQNDQSRIEALERRIAELEAAMASVAVQDGQAPFVCNKRDREHVTAPLPARPLPAAPAPATPPVRDGARAPFIRDKRDREHVTAPLPATPLPAAGPSLATLPVGDGARAPFVRDKRDHRPPHAPGNRLPQPNVPTEPPVSVPRVYEYSSPTQPLTTTQHWPQAARATQGVAASHVRTIYKEPVRQKKIKVWVVFRGWQVGVFHEWQPVKQATEGFRHAVQQGFATINQATRAFEYAQENSWTSTTPRSTGLPVDINLVPKPLETDDPSVIGDRLRPREPEDWWYIVYVGINPGVFPTYLECALNTSGVKGMVHNKRRTFADALAEFERSQRHSEVRECRTPSA